MFNIGDIVRVSKDTDLLSSVKKGDMGIIEHINTQFNWYDVRMYNTGKMYNFDSQDIELVSSVPMSLPIGNQSLLNEIVENKVKCECGLASINSGGRHSDWCPIKE